MKWAFLLITLLFSLFTYGQVPQSFNYQAVARDASGKVIVGQLAARFKLHEDNAAGTTRYAETHTVTTNDQGIFSLQERLQYGPAAVGIAQVVFSQYVKCHLFHPAKCVL